MTRSLLDTNVFIRAKNLHYGFDFCPAFWDWLIDKNQSDEVGGIEKAGDELVAGQDDLSDWAQARGRAFFAPPDKVVIPALGRVSTWTTGQQFEPAAIATFPQVADYWLVGHALAHQCTVVTHEAPSTSVRKIKIPNVSVGLGVTCVSPYEMLLRERARFVIG